jgi:hypothetical protein
VSRLSIERGLSGILIKVAGEMAMFQQLPIRKVFKGENKTAICRDCFRVADLLATELSDMQQKPFLRICSPGVRRIPVYKRPSVDSGTPLGGARTIQVRNPSDFDAQLADYADL